MKTVFATDKILDSTSAGQGAVYTVEQSDRAVQVVLTGTGELTATVKVEVSLNGEHFIELATLTLAGENSAVDGFASTAPWRYVRASITQIAGTGARAQVFIGV